MKNLQILGVAVSDTNEQEALEFIVRSLEKGDKKVKIFTPNPEIIMEALKDVGFKRVLNTADLALADGMGVFWAAKVLGVALQKRITGVDFMEKLCNEAGQRGFTVGLLGGGPKIAERAAECLSQRYPNLKIAFVGEEWSEQGFIHSTVNHKSIDILFVAYGFPKQEQWIDENLPKIPVKVAMAVGGSFDYISGAVPRAPLLVRQLGFEWLFRLIREPWRVKRQLQLIAFVLKVLQTKFSHPASS